ncbi:MAG: hypothetical protein V7629_09365 [Motiliproteus sp.]
MREDPSTGEFASVLTADAFGCALSMVYGSQRQRLLIDSRGAKILEVDLTTYAWGRVDTEFVGAGPSVAQTGDLVFRAA